MTDKKALKLIGAGILAVLSIGWGLIALSEPADGCNDPYLHTTMACFR